MEILDLKLRSGRSNLKLRISDLRYRSVNLPIPLIVVCAVVLPAAFYFDEQGVGLNFDPSGSFLNTSVRMNSCVRYVGS